ncbi:ABC transporter permease subunit [bacterium]|nr:ABC transporter permease subunit [bacterium]
MRNILTVARFTFLEMVRNKILYALLFFAFFVIGLGIAITQMTIGDNLNVISDIGLGSVEMFSTIIAIFMGVTLIHQELKMRTIYLLFARPIRRWQYLAGKFFGMSLLILIEIIFMALILEGLFIAYGGPEKIITYLPAFYSIFLQTMTVIAMAVLCSSLTEIVVGAILTIAFYITGAISYNLQYALDSRISESAMKMVTMLRYILPDFSYFNIKDNLVYGRGLEGINLWVSTGYALTIIVILLSASLVFFNQKELL